MTAYVFDVDETLLDTSERKARAATIAAGKKVSSGDVRGYWGVGKWVDKDKETVFLREFLNPDYFHLDRPVEGAADVVKDCDGRGKVIYTTGRPITGREQTLKSLKNHGFPVDRTELIMNSGEEISGFKLRAMLDLCERYDFVIGTGDQLHDFYAFHTHGAKSVILAVCADTKYDEVPDYMLVDNWNGAGIRIGELDKFYAELRKERAEILRKIVDELGVVIEEKDILEILRGCIKTGAYCERASIYRTHGDELTTLVADGVQPFTIKIGDNYLTSQCARGSKAFFNNFVQKEKGRSKNIERTVHYPEYNTAMVPVIVKGEVVGVLKGLNAPEGFDRTALEFMKALTPYTSQAFLRADAHKHALALSQHIYEIGIARSMQLNLLPPRPLKTDSWHIAGRCLPCEEVGGDIFLHEIFGHEELGEIVFLYHADISGHGFPAVLSLNATVGFLRGYVTGGYKNLEAVGKELNSHLISTLPDGMFVTAFLGYLYRDGRVEYLVMGHPAPLVRRKSGKVEKLEVINFPLGVRDFDANSLDLQMDAGDMFVLYTDGVTESMNEEKKQFGLDRLSSLITGKGEPEFLASSIVSAAQEHSIVVEDGVHRPKIRDDMCVVVAKRI